ncbi:MAG: hypothetical protein EZS28_003152, partial [Streblomastix strix]
MDSALAENPLGASVIDNIFDWDYANERVITSDKPMIDLDKKTGRAEEFEEYSHLIGSSRGREYFNNALNSSIPTAQALLRMISSRSELLKRISFSTRKELESEAEVSTKIKKDERVTIHSEIPSTISVALNFCCGLTRGMCINTPQAASVCVGQLANIMLQLGPRSLSQNTNAAFDTIESLIRDLGRIKIIDKEDQANTLLTMGLTTGRIRYLLGSAFELLQLKRKKIKKKQQEQEQQQQQENILNREKKQQIKSLFESISVLKDLSGNFTIDVQSNTTQWKTSIIGKQGGEEMDSKSKSDKESGNKSEIRGDKEKNVLNCDNDSKYVFVLRDENKVKRIGTGNSGTILGREYKEIEIGKNNKQEMKENKTIQIVGLFCTTFPQRRFYIVHKLFGKAEDKKGINQQDKEQDNEIINEQPIMSVYDSETLELIEEVFDSRILNQLNSKSSQSSSSSSSSSSNESNFSINEEMKNQLSKNGVNVSFIGICDIFDQIGNICGRYEFVRKYLLSAKVGKIYEQQSKKETENETKTSEDKQKEKEKESGKEKESKLQKEMETIQKLEKYFNDYGKQETSNQEQTTSNQEQTEEEDTTDEIPVGFEKLPWQQNNVSGSTLRNHMLQSYGRFISDGQYVLHISTIMHYNTEQFGDGSKVEQDKQNPLFAFVRIFDPNNQWKLIRTHLIDLQISGNHLQCKVCLKDIKSKRYFICQDCKKPSPIINTKTQNVIICQECVSNGNSSSIHEQWHKLTLCEGVQEAELTLSELISKASCFSNGRTLCFVRTGSGDVQDDLIQFELNEIVEDEQTLIERWHQNETNNKLNEEKQNKQKQKQQKDEEQSDSNIEDDDEDEDIFQRLNKHSNDANDSHSTESDTNQFQGRVCSNVICKSIDLIGSGYSSLDREHNTIYIYGRIGGKISSVPLFEGHGPIFENEKGNISKSKYRENDNLRENEQLEEGELKEDQNLNNPYSLIINQLETAVHRTISESALDTALIATLEFTVHRTISESALDTALIATLEFSSPSDSLSFLSQLLAGQTQEEEEEVIDEINMNNNDQELNKNKIIQKIGNQSEIQRLKQKRKGEKMLQRVFSSVRGRMDALMLSMLYDPKLGSSQRLLASQIPIVRTDNDSFKQITIGSKNEVNQQKNQLIISKSINLNQQQSNNWSGREELRRVWATIVGIEVGASKSSLENILQSNKEEEKDIQNILFGSTSTSTTTIQLTQALKQEQDINDQSDQASLRQFLQTFQRRICSLFFRVVKKKINKKGINTTDQQMKLNQNEQKGEENTSETKINQIKKRNTKGGLDIELADVDASKNPIYPYFVDYCKLIFNGAIEVLDSISSQIKMIERDGKRKQDKELELEQEKEKEKEKEQIDEKEIRLGNQKEKEKEKQISSSSSSQSSKLKESQRSALIDTLERTMVGTLTRSLIDICWILGQRSGEVCVQFISYIAKILRSYDRAISTIAGIDQDKLNDSEQSTSQQQNVNINIESIRSKLEREEISIFQTSKQPARKAAPVRIETPHPYQNNQDWTKVVRIAGASGYQLKFNASCKTERNYDYLNVYEPAAKSNPLEEDKPGKQLFNYNGTGFPKEIVTIQQSALVFKFHSDGSGTDWGIELDVEAIFPPQKESKAPWWVVEYEHNLSYITIGLAKNAIIASSIDTNQQIDDLNKSQTITNSNSYNTRQRFRPEIEVWEGSCIRYKVLLDDKSNEIASLLFPYELGRHALAIACEEIIRRSSLFALGIRKSLAQIAVEFCRTVSSVQIIRTSLFRQSCEQLRESGIRGIMQIFVCDDNKKINIKKLNEKSSLLKLHVSEIELMRGLGSIWQVLQQCDNVSDSEYTGLGGIGTIKARIAEEELFQRVVSSAHLRIINFRNKINEQSGFNNKTDKDLRNGQIIIETRKMLALLSALSRKPRSMRLLKPDNLQQPTITNFRSLYTTEQEQEQEQETDQQISNVIEDIITIEDGQNQDIMPIFYEGQFSIQQITETTNNKYFDQMHIVQPSYFSRISDNALIGQLKEQMRFAGFYFFRTIFLNTLDSEDENVNNEEQENKEIKQSSSSSSLIDAQIFIDDTNKNSIPSKKRLILCLQRYLKLASKELEEDFIRVGEANNYNYTQNFQFSITDDSFAYTCISFISYLTDYLQNDKQTQSQIAIHVFKEVVRLSVLGTPRIQR